MNGIARHHIAIKQLSLFSITYYVIYYSFSSHSIIIIQILFNYTFNIVSTTNCNSKIYDLFVKLINHFKIYSLTSLIFILYPSLNLTPFLFLYYLLLYFMYICPFWRVTFSIAIQYIFILNYHMSITYAYAYIIVYTKTLDSLLYYFIVSNQSFLLIKICNTIDILYQMKKVEMNHIFTGLILSILCYYNGSIIYKYIIFLDVICTGRIPCIDGSCALLLFKLHSIVFNLIILFMFFLNILCSHTIIIAIRLYLTTSCTYVERSNIKPVHVVQKRHTYILHECPTVHFSCTHIQCKIMSEYSNSCYYVDFICTFHSFNIMLCISLFCVYRFNSEFHNIYFTIDYG